MCMQHVSKAVGLRGFRSQINSLQGWESIPGPHTWQPGISSADHHDLQSVLTEEAVA